MTFPDGIPDAGAPLYRFCVGVQRLHVAENGDMEQVSANHEANAFENTALTEIIFPESLTRIGGMRLRALARWKHRPAGKFEHDWFVCFFWHWDSDAEAA